MIRHSVQIVNLFRLITGSGRRRNMLRHIQTNQWERNVYLLLRTVHQLAAIVYVHVESVNFASKECLLLSNSHPPLKVYDQNFRQFRNVQLLHRSPLIFALWTLPVVNEFTVEEIVQTLLDVR